MNKPNALQELAKQRYLQQINSLTSIQKKRALDITTIALTLFAFTFFGVFAITPTLSTIVQLQKQVSDAKYTRDQLDQKKATMSSLIAQYNNLSPDLPVVLRAIPQSPTVPTLVGQVQTLTQENNLHISALSTEPATLFDTTKGSLQSNSYNFLITVSGAYSDIESFVSALTKFDRIVTVTDVTISRNTNNNNNSNTDTNTLTAAISGRAYYQK